MRYTLLTNDKWIPCKDHSELDVFYTARTISKYSHSIVDVYRNNVFIAVFEKGKRVRYQASAKLSSEASNLVCYNMHK